MKLTDLRSPEDLEVEIVSRAYRDLREFDASLADSMTYYERSVFEAGVASGCRNTLRMISEVSEPC